jgi:hypothetical protein
MLWSPPQSICTKPLTTPALLRGDEKNFLFELCAWNPCFQPSLEASAGGYVTIAQCSQASYLCFPP